MRSNLISKFDSFWKSILTNSTSYKKSVVEHLKVEYVELNFQVQYKSDLFTFWTRGWICLEVEFTKIDFQKESNLLNKFECMLSGWNILEIELFGKFCPGIGCNMKSAGYEVILVLEIKAIDNSFHLGPNKKIKGGKVKVTSIVFLQVYDRFLMDYRMHGWSTC